MLIRTDNYGTWEWLHHHIVSGKLIDPILTTMPFAAKESYPVVHKGLGNISYWLPRSNRDRVYKQGMGSLCL